MEKTCNSSAVPEQFTDHNDTATGSGTNIECPHSPLSGQEDTPNTRPWTSTSSGHSSSASSKHECSVQMVERDVDSGQNVNHIATSSPRLPWPFLQYLRSRKIGTKSCSSASESLHDEPVAQTSGINNVSEQSNQNAPASGSNNEHNPSLPASESLQHDQTSERNGDSVQNMNHPSLFLLSNKRSYRNICLPLHMAALEGDVDKVKTLVPEGENGRSMLGEAITERYETVLHVATGAKQTKFAEEIVQLMRVEELALQDEKGNTAFCFAAAAGTIPIAEIMLKKNPSLSTLRGSKNKTPLYLAALFGQREMALFLYHESKSILTEEDKKDIFFISIDTGLYDLALELFKNDKNMLAVARNKEGLTALHMLAVIPSAFTNESPGQLKTLINSLVPGFTTHKIDLSSQALQLVNDLWKEILEKEDVDAVEFISTPSKLLFHAARMGNFKFLAILIRSYPILVHQLDENDQSIFHIAVMYRHAAAFNLIYEIGFDKQVIATYVDKDQNNILHLAAKYLTEGRAISSVPGAALEMQQELITFKEVELLVMPAYREMKNKNGYTPRELFSNQHAALLERGEKWMKQTAKSCSFVATIIATVVFAATFSVPGGTSDANGLPNLLRATFFHIFAMADAVALFSSSISILMFLSILTSRYAENDFLWSLPLQLVTGISTLFISIVAMMLTFGSSFFLAYSNQPTLKVIPISITTLVFVPVALYVLLQYDLFKDVLYSSFRFRFSIKPGKQAVDKLLYSIISNN